MQAPNAVAEASPARRSAGLFVLAVWAAMSAATLAMSWRYALTSPYADEWHWIRSCHGPSINTTWLFQVETVHRFPLSKLVYWLLGAATHFDFRAGALASVTLLSLLSLGLLLVVRRTRGGWNEIDVFIPLMLMQWGQAYNLVWGSQIAYVLPVVLGGLILLLAVSAGPQVSVTRAAAVTILLVAMAGCGGPGVCYLPAIGLWLAYTGLLQWRSGLPSGRSKAAAIWLLAGLVTGTLAAHQLGNLSSLAKSEHAAAVHDGPIVGTLQFLSVSMGRIGREIWPASAVIVLAALGLALWRLSRVWRAEPNQRARAVGLACYLGALVTVGLAIGVARSPMGPRACMEERYVTLGAPLWVGLYFVAVCYGPALGGRRWSLGIAILMLAVTLGYNRHGLLHVLQYRAKIDRLESLVRDGMAPRVVAACCHDDMQSPEDLLTRDLEMLQAARIGPYRASLIAAAPRRVSVVPLVRLVTDIEPYTPVLVTGQSPLVQPLVPLGDKRLVRVDVKLRREAREPRVVPWAWTIDQLESGGSRRTIRQGQGRPEEMADPLFAKLEFDALSVAPGMKLELVLRPAADAPGGKPLCVPVYEGPVESKPRSNLGGFLFFEE